MTTRITSFILVFALSLFTIGCDGGGSAMEEEPTELEKMTLTIYNAPDSKAQTNTTIDRNASSLKSGDLLNIFVRDREDNGNTEAEETEVPYPNKGDVTEVVFTVPAGDYDVDLLGYRDLDNPNKNSAIVYATTGTSGSVDVEPGEVEEVDFTNDAQSDIFSEFGLSFDANLEFAGNSKRLSVTLEDDDGNAQKLAEDILAAGGGIGISPNANEIDSHDYTSGRNSSPFGSPSGATVTTKDNINLPPGQYKDGEAAVVFELKITDSLVGDGQDPIYLYNDPNGDPAEGVNIGGKGGIIVII